MVRPFFVVVDEELSKVRPCLKRIAVLLKVDLSVLDGSPQSFHEDIIQGPASAIHADIDPVILQDVREILARVLGALVSVEDLRLPISLKRFFQSACAKTRIQGVRKLPGQDLAAEPVHYDREIKEALAHAHIRDIRAPDLVGRFMSRFLKRYV